MTAIDTTTIHVGQLVIIMRPGTWLGSGIVSAIRKDNRNRMLFQLLLDGNHYMTVLSSDIVSATDNPFDGTRR